MLEVYAPAGTRIRMHLLAVASFVNGKPNLSISDKHVIEPPKRRIRLAQSHGSAQSVKRDLRLLITAVHRAQVKWITTYNNRIGGASDAVLSTEVIHFLGAIKAV